MKDLKIFTREVYWECGEPGCCSGTNYYTTITEDNEEYLYEVDSSEALLKHLKEVHGISVEIDGVYDDGGYFDEED